jgi:hypothetical protein
MEERNLKIHGHLVLADVSKAHCRYLQYALSSDERVILFAMRVIKMKCILRSKVLLQRQINIQGK